MLANGLSNTTHLQLRSVCIVRLRRPLRGCLAGFTAQPDRVIAERSLSRCRRTTRRAAVLKTHRHQRYHLMAQTLQLATRSNSQSLGSSGRDGSCRSVLFVCLVVAPRDQLRSINDLAICAATWKGHSGEQILVTCTQVLGS